MSETFALYCTLYMFEGKRCTIRSVWLSIRYTIEGIGLGNCKVGIRESACISKVIPCAIEGGI